MDISRPKMSAEEFFESFESLYNIVHVWRKETMSDFKPHNFIITGPGPCYHVIIFDVDSKDLGVGMSFPPQAFVNKTFLASVQSLLHQTGQ